MTTNERNIEPFVHIPVVANQNRNGLGQPHTDPTFLQPPLVSTSYDILTTESSSPFRRKDTQQQLRILNQDYLQTIQDHKNEIASIRPRRRKIQRDNTTCCISDWDRSYTNKNIKNKMISNNNPRYEMNDDDNDHDEEDDQYNKVLYQPPILTGKSSTTSCDKQIQQQDLHYSITHLEELSLLDLQLESLIGMICDDALDELQEIDTSSNDDTIVVDPFDSSTMISAFPKTFHNKIMKNNNKNTIHHRTTIERMEDNILSCIDLIQALQEEMDKETKFASELYEINHHLRIDILQLHIRGGPRNHRKINEVMKEK